MSQNLCRLCLGVNNLKDIFTETGTIEGYTAVLASTTGVRIEPNDGLPQKICTECTNAVNEALKLRNQAQLSETTLIQMGYQKRLENAITLKDLCPTNLEKDTPNLENISADLEYNENILQKADVLEELQTDGIDFDGFKIEVEVDRVTLGSHENDQNNEAKTELVQPTNKNSRKEKRRLYLSLVEGEYKPNEPVQCKVCKVTVSKWACFTNHVKKHLGFKFVCEFCGASFISSNQLKRHCRSLHGLQRELRCPRPHCDYLALDNAQLQVHERRTHTGERPYVCATCGNAYYSRKCLVQHTESHRESATVQCEQCPLVFKSRRHLAKHRYGVHSDKRRARRLRLRGKQAPAPPPGHSDGAGDGSG